MKMLSHFKARILVSISSKSAIILFMCLGLLAFSSATSSGAFAYSCGSNDPKLSHCYARAISYENQYPFIVIGQRSNIFMSPLECSHCANFPPFSTPGFIDNEMWLAGTNTTDPQNNPQVWVEVGYSTFSDLNTTTTNYFWADWRPLYGYAEHVMEQVPSGDYHHTDTFWVWADSQTANHFDIYINSPGGTHLYGASTNNFMAHPYIFAMGSELAGNAGANQDDQVAYSYRQIQSSNSYWENILNFYTIDNNPNSPPYFWSLGNSNDDFYTTCC